MIRELENEDSSGETAPSVKLPGLKQVQSKSVNRYEEMDPITTRVKSHETIQWLKSRCQSTAKTSSLLSFSEISRNKDIIKIFENFDEDRSGQLELKEIVQMLEVNGMKLNKRHAQEFFDVLDADKSGGLSINEFKDFLFSEDCRISK